MEEIDSYGFQIKKFWSDQASSPVHFLMTQERTQALDLLVHLLSNSSESIAVCGPDGVGKTTLVKALQHHGIASCHFCLVEGDKALSLNKVREYIDKIRKQEKFEKTSRTFTNSVQEQRTLQEKIVLIIDNAGTLAPGLLTQIAQYANEYSYLQVIWVLTHDHLHLKMRSDQIIEDSHIIEIPTLSEKQCGDFLQHLSVKSTVSMPASAITDEMIATIYKNTHGIAAKVITEFSAIPSPRQHRRQEDPTRILIGSVAGLILIALGVQWYSARLPLSVKEPLLVMKELQLPAKIDLNLPYLTLPFPGLSGDFHDSYLAINLDDNILTEDGRAYDAFSCGKDDNSLIPATPVDDRQIEHNRDMILSRTLETRKISDLK